MKLQTMRAVDFWVGIPLCFFFTAVVRGLDAFAAKGPEKPQRVLFIELSEMGSTIVANPAMQKAKDELGAEIFFLIFARNAASLRLLDTVPSANVVTIREHSVGVLVADTIRFLMWARRERIDTVVDLEMFSRYSGLLTGLSGAVRRVGFYRFTNEGLYRGEMLTHRVAYNSHLHIAKNFVSMINALLAPVPELPYSKKHVSEAEIRLPIRPVSRLEENGVHALIREVYPEYDEGRHRVVLINPNSSELVPNRRWPMENFARLASMMLREWEDVLILLTGSKGEVEESLRLEAEVKHPRIRSLAGKHSLEALIPLYHVGKILVTNDSGPGHFSAITPIRSIVLYGPETPKLYGSLGNSEAITAELPCSPCVSAANHRNSACNDPVCMRMISPERVMASIREVLVAQPMLSEIRSAV
jgi:ADP-heptose:LPS heptosyltransferase